MVSNGSDIATTIALQADGKVVAGGYSGLARYNRDGSLDTTFGANGQITGFNAAGVAIQSDGKIVVGCSFYIGSNTDFGLIRYNPDGSLDTSFGMDGKVSASISAVYDIVQSIAIQSDGKIVAAGYTADTAYSFAVARFNADGSLDTTFDGDGKLITLVGLDGGRGTSIALQTDGKIVIGGGAYMGSGIESAFVIIRYNVNGSLDTSFDSDGIVTTSFNSYAFASSVAIQSDGKIVAGGGASVLGAGDEFALARYDPDGSLDTTFDLDGKLTTSFGVNEVGFVSAVAIQIDGKVVAAGSRNSGSVNLDLAVARYNSDGSLDTTFDLDGIVTTDGGGDEQFTAVAIQPDGRIVGAGGGFNGSYLGGDFIIARYGHDGSLDTGFDADGLAVTNFRVYQGNLLSGVAIQANGKIVVAGTSLARYNSDGTAATLLLAAGPDLLSWDFLVKPLPSRTMARS